MTPIPELENSLPGYWYRMRRISPRPQIPQAKAYVDARKRILRDSREPQKLGGVQALTTSHSSSPTLRKRCGRRLSK